MIEWLGHSWFGGKCAINGLIIQFMRICSLLPGATEIACALGLADEIVGVSHECDFPAAARTKPVMVRSRIDPERSSKARQVLKTSAGRPLSSVLAVQPDSSRSTVQSFNEGGRLPRFGKSRNVERRRSSILS
jgi:hypothetical protein